MFHLGLTGQIGLEGRYEQGSRRAENALETPNGEMDNRDGIVCHARGMHSGDPSTSACRLSLP